MDLKKYFVVFILSELYYLPVYEPLALKLRENKLPYLFLVRTKSRHNKVDSINIAIDHLQINKHPFKKLEGELNDISSVYRITAANGYVDHQFDYKYSVLMSHGIGTKTGYFSEEHTLFDIRFVEGEYRKTQMELLFPNMKTKLFNVGFSKLDAGINLSHEEKNNIISNFNLDSSKKTILYSPTFYPSSIEKIDKNFPKDFADFNIIIKPHSFSYELKKYKNQVKLFNYWAGFKNVFIADLKDFNLIHFMAVSDIMITDESSAMFEFIALNKPVICYRDVKLRLSYILLKNKLTNRMESNLSQYKKYFTNVYKYQELKPEVNDLINNPYRDESTRLKLADELVGKCDGKVSERILKELLAFNHS